jgi:hypothetical protein
MLDVYRLTVNNSTMLKLVSYIIVAVLVLVGLTLAWGSSLPTEVTARREAALPAPVNRVFALVTDVGRQGNWRSDVGAVAVAPDRRTWTETTKRGITIAFEEVERVESALYVIRFSSPQGFTGEWRGTFSSAAQGTSVIFTETITTPGLIGRVLARLFAPPGAHIDLYLADLKRALAT